MDELLRKLENLEVHHIFFESHYAIDNQACSLESIRQLCQGAGDTEMYTRMQALPANQHTEALVNQDSQLKAIDFRVGDKVRTHRKTWIKNTKESSWSGGQSRRTYITIAPENGG